MYAVLQAFNNTSLVAYLHFSGKLFVEKTEHDTTGKKRTESEGTGTNKVRL